MAITVKLLGVGEAFDANEPEPAVASINGLIDVTPNQDIAHRAWRYVTLCDGHDAAWWRGFVAALRSVGYEDVLSIEHEDTAAAPLEGVRRSVALLREAGV